MKATNRPSKDIEITLTEKDLARVKREAQSLGLTVDDYLHRAMKAGIDNKFKRPSKAPVLRIK